VCVSCAAGNKPACRLYVKASASEVAQKAELTLTPHISALLDSGLIPATTDLAALMKLMSTLNLVPSGTEKQQQPPEEIAQQQAQNKIVQPQPQAESADNLDGEHCDGDTDDDPSVDDETDRLEREALQSMEETLKTPGEASSSDDDEPELVEPDDGCGAALAALHKTDTKTAIDSMFDDVFNKLEGECTPVGGTADDAVAELGSAAAGVDDPAVMASVDSLVGQACAAVIDKTTCKDIPTHHACPHNHTPTHPDTRRPTPVVWVTKTFTRRLAESEIIGPKVCDHWSCLFGSMSSTAAITLWLPTQWL
jgi:hypothetical protein